MSRYSISLSLYMYYLITIILSVSLSARKCWKAREDCERNGASDWRDSEEDGGDSCCIVHCRMWEKGWKNMEILLLLSLSAFLLVYVSFNVFIMILMWAEVHGQAQLAAEVRRALRDLSFAALLGVARRCSLLFHGIASRTGRGAQRKDRGTSGPATSFVFSLSIYPKQTDLKWTHKWLN